ncbi:transcription factor E2F2-like [Mercenaria mercenaria]|uniref:transcription factor E2F2-like n=1 Tax=Mercenaria mercenaria TaxID=6596 RepID=UPI00234E9196|nr:transcription factor E2F2-like [Mercenaria mercenaria]
MTMSRGGALTSRRFSLPVIKQESFESTDSAQIMNLTSIFSSPPYHSSHTLTKIKEEPIQWSYVNQAQGLTPSGHSYRPLAEKNTIGRPQLDHVYFTPSVNYRINTAGVQGCTNSIAANPDANNRLSSATVDLHSDLADLEAKENNLDHMINTCTRSLKQLTENPDNSKLAYVTYQDIRSIRSLDEQTVIAIKAPPETRLEVPDPGDNIQIWLKSSKGPIEVYLCPEEVNNQPDPNTTTSSNADSACSTSNTSSSGEDSFFSEDSTSCDSFRGNPALKNALLEDQDISPDLGHSLLLQTEDQNLDENFVSLGPLEDYMFSLEDGEGISDLFDAYPFDL